MKWLLISMEIWGDGNYTFGPRIINNSYNSEATCLSDIRQGQGVSIINQPYVYHGYICLPETAWKNFEYNWNGRR